jgi:hypothetical protein
MSQLHCIRCNIARGARWGRFRGLMSLAGLIIAAVMA